MYILYYLIHSTHTPLPATVLPYPGVTVPCGQFYFGVLIVILLALNVFCQCHSNCFKSSNLKPRCSKVNGIPESDHEIQCLNV